MPALPRSRAATSPGSPLRTPAEGSTTSSVMFPHVARAQRGSARAMAAIARALSVMDPIAGLEALAVTTGAPRALSELGMPREGIARVVDAVTFDRAIVRSVLESAYARPVR